MSFELPTRRRSPVTRPSWSGMAMVVEAMLLLVFLVASLAILTGLFSASVVRSREGRDLACAVSAATNAAERFAADPASVEGTWQEGELTVTCDVTDEPTAAGTLYHADIQVFPAGEADAIYVLSTARYEGRA